MKVLAGRNDVVYGESINYEFARGAVTVLLDGADVTRRCRWFDVEAGSVGLFPADGQGSIISPDVGEFSGLVQVVADEQVLADLRAAKVAGGWSPEVAAWDNVASLVRQALVEGKTRTVEQGCASLRDGGCSFHAVVVVKGTE